MRNRVFAPLCGWVAVAGSLTGEGIAHHVLWVFVTGMAMSVICPLGLIALQVIKRGIPRE